jgi:UDP-N-acetylmuramoyl-L-alanyl-D-glutamate--2,6-diaminopimelate ligase
LSAASGAGPFALAELAPGIRVVPADLQVSDLSLDSRAVQPGGLFLACAGLRSHGVAHVPEALARGARAVLWEPAAGIDPPLVPDDVFLAAMPGLGAQVGALADRFFGAPSAALAIAGVTGTNGKTTVAWLLAQALGRAARRCGYSGTLGTGIPPHEVAAGTHTTGDAVSVHRQLAALRAAGADSVAMEVSSHALAQHRVEGVRFRVAAFTNLTRDHLDFHGTMEAYGAAKSRLFDWPDLAARVINVDDAFGALLARRPRAPGRLFITCRTPAGRAAAATLRQRADVIVLRASELRATGRGMAWQLASPAGTREVEVPLLGDFNVDNAMTVIGLLLALEVPLDDALHALERTAAPPGRMEAIVTEGRPLAIVDYAHTPDALAKALRAARAHCAGRLHVVFGCGGDRDTGKRPQMGRIAAELSDTVVVTDDNPRGESSARIAADILAGVPAGRRAEVIPDRSEAIRSAVARAGLDDVVLVAGKGHEDYQLVGAERRPFSDQHELRAAFSGVDL